MKEFLITIKVSTENKDAVNALTYHLENDILPDACNIDTISINSEIYERSFHGFNTEDIEHCADQYHDIVLSDSQIIEVFDFMEHRFDAEWGVNWQYISFCIGEILCLK